MWSFAANTTSWARRHKRTVACGAMFGVALAGYTLYKNVAPMLLELKNNYILLRQVEADMALERDKFHQERLSRAFQQTQEACRFALTHLALEIRSKIASLYDIDELKSLLRTEGSTSHMEQFKVAVISRTISMLYCLSLSSVVIRLQLCIAGRYATDNCPQQLKANNAFMQMAQYIASTGAGDIVALVNASVAVIVSNNMQSCISRDQLSMLLSRLRGHIENDVVTRSAKFAVPCMDRVENVLLMQMHSELLQLLSSSSITIVINASLKIAFQMLNPLFDVFAGKNDSEVLLGRTLPKFARIFESDMPRNITEAENSPLLNALTEARELSHFGAIVFFPVGYSPSLHPETAA